MINNKCFYVYCSNGFVAYVWASTPAKAKALVVSKKLAPSCYRTCGNGGCLKTYRCTLLDDKYSVLGNFYYYVNKKIISDKFIDEKSQFGEDFLTIFARDLVSFNSMGYVNRYHHSNRARVKWDLECIDADGGNSWD